MILERDFVSILFLAYLAICAWQDYKCCAVYDITHYPGVILAGRMADISCMEAGTAMSLLAFSVLQYLLFRRMYGDADVMCFLICALSLGGSGSMMLYLIHMLVTYLFLGVHQAIRRNISGDGNLKVPVPMIPYILVAYLVVKILMKLYN